MEINTGNLPSNLVEANIVEPLKARAGDGTLAVVGDEEVLLPPHENVVFSREVDIFNNPLLQALTVGFEGIEFLPVRQVCSLVGVPLVLGQEAVFRPDNLAFKVGAYRGIVWGQAWSSLSVYWFRYDRGLGV